MKFQFSPIAAAILVAYGLSSPSIANAQFVSSLGVSNASVTGSYTVSGTTQTQTGTSVSAASTDYGVNSSDLSYYPYASYSGDTNTGNVAAYARAGGLTTPWYGSISGTLVPFTNATSSISYHATFTNNASTASNYNFNFQIGGGELNTYQWTTASASVIGSIFVNGALAWSTNASLDQNGLFSQSGANLGFTANNAQWDQYDYQFGTYNGSVSLGFLNPSQSVTVDYVLQSVATANGFDYYGGSIASIMDPLSVSGGNVANGISVTTVSPVPVPESYALFASGLGLLATRVRRNKNKRA